MAIVIFTRRFFDYQTTLGKHSIYSYRHHEAGIKQVEEMWGKQAALAARRHILSDLQQEGWKMGDHFPQDEADYVRMGLF